MGKTNFKRLKYPLLRTKMTTLLSTSTKDVFHTDILFVVFSGLIWDNFNCGRLVFLIPHSLPYPNNTKRQAKYNFLSHWFDANQGLKIWV